MVEGEHRDCRRVKFVSVSELVAGVDGFVYLDDRRLLNGHDGGIYHQGIIQQSRIQRDSAKGGHGDRRRAWHGLDTGNRYADPGRCDLLLSGE